MKKLINYIVFMSEIGDIKWILRIGVQETLLVDHKFH